MIEGARARVLVARDDLLANASLIERREQDADAELTRLLLVRRFIAASFELSRALRAQTECALVNHCGTAGTRSLQEASELLYGAFEEYALRCREVAVGARTADEAPDSRSWEGSRAVI